MDKRINIGIVGDFSSNMHTHVALNESVAHSSPKLHFELDTSWIPTEDVNDEFIQTQTFNGFWLAPGSPYQNDDGVFKLIQWCRENNFPLLGTCGGFQYMLVEFARNFLGLKDADHEETSNKGSLVISKLACSLKGKEEKISITDQQSWLYESLRTYHLTGHYYCSYGVNPMYTKLLNQYPMMFTAFSSDGEPRAFEFKAHRFYCGTLFQPSLTSTATDPNPLITNFLEKCAG